MNRSGPSAMTKLPEPTFGIVGAGLCGLTLGTKLREANFSTYLLEKSRSVGGRMATRRDGWCTYDHGAAFYIHSDHTPFYWHAAWASLGKSKNWFTDRSGSHGVGLRGMNSLAKLLVESQTIHLQEKVLRIDIHPKGVELICESGRRFSATKAILTCPLPQSLEILRTSQISYPTDLNELPYAKALVGLFELEESKADLTFKTYASDLFSIANNQAKGISAAPCLTVVMSDAWSEHHFESPDEEILNGIQAALLTEAPQLRIKKRQLKKWRFSHPQRTYQSLFETIADGKILLAGDAFGGGSLAGAIRSALAVLNQI